jgi:neogenin
MIIFRKRKPELSKPDLWIHHDHMELKNVEKGGARRAESLISPSSRGSREYPDLDEKLLQCNTNSLDKKNFLSSYLVSEREARNTLSGRSIKSQLLSDTSGHMSDGTKTYETTASGSSAASSQNNLHTMAQYR